LSGREKGLDDPHEVTIEDARGRESEFTLDRNGFALVRASTAVADFYSSEEIKGVYYPEVERLLRGKLGASRVFVFDHNVRNATREGLAVPSSPHERPIKKSSSSPIVQNLVHRITDHLVPVVRVPTDADPRGPAQFQWASMLLHRRRYRAIVTFSLLITTTKISSAPRLRP
jgi:hypothetical protein